MKKYRQLLGLVCLLFSFGILLHSCTEEQTLDGAKEVYITISPEDPFILVGDTVPLNAEISNLAGKPINTPIEWKSDDESIVSIYQDAMVAQNGAQGKSTKVRAILPNGKYALITVTVSTHTLSKITPEKSIQYTYSKNNDSVWFRVEPKELLLDFAPTVENSNPELLIPVENPVFVDAKLGRVAYVFNSGNVTDKAKITLSIANSETSASTQVVVSPSIYVSLGDDFNAITYENSFTMDINSNDTVWVNTKVDPTYEIDLENAKKLYNWRVDGNAAQMVNTGVIVVPNLGHRAYAVLRSGNFTGQTVVKFECNETELTSTIDVQNYTTQYPVDTLDVNKTELEISVGATAYVTPRVVPVSSYGIHLPKFTPADPSIVKVVGYNGSEMGLQGLKMGETDVVVTSNDKSVTIRVKVTEDVLGVILQSDNKKILFEGQSTQWYAKVNTSGSSEVKPNWISENEAIATVDTEGVVTAHQGGSVNIKAAAGNKVSAPAVLKVIGIPTASVDYTNGNTDEYINAAYIENGKLIVAIESLTQDPFTNVSIFITQDEAINAVTEATYSTSNSLIQIDADGAKAQVTAGSLTIKAGDDEYSKKIDADLTITIGSKSFTVRISDLIVWI
ncbi:MAG: Ig-like domain-containing protein [Bacteroidales bacterium]